MKHQSAANTSLLLVFLSLSTWLQYQYLMECIILFKQVQRTSYVCSVLTLGQTSMSSPVFIFSYSRFTYNVVKQPWHANFTQNITEETTFFFSQNISQTWKAARNRIPVYTGISTAAPCLVRNLIMVAGSVFQSASQSGHWSIKSSISVCKLGGETVIESEIRLQSGHGGTLALFSSVSVVNSYRETVIQ